MLAGISRYAGNTVLIVSGLCISVFLAWHTLSAGNFFYPLLHDVIGVEETIAEYAPRNIYRKSFDQTTREQRAELFRQLVYGINHDGEGLQAIRYVDAQGQPVDFLLREAEITHLNDVSRLLGKLWQATGFAGVLFIGTVMFYRLRKINIPAPRHVLAGMTLAILVMAAMASVAGAEKLFYQWHTLVFPAGHQWFFYYEESLMTMLMKAPDLFAYLAVLLVLFALAFYYLILRLVHAWLGKYARPA